MNKIDLKKYRYPSKYFIGEVMDIDGEYITIMLYPDKYREIRLSTPIYISSGECGSLGFSISNITRAKYGKEFALIKRDAGSETPNIYPDIKTHYNYIVRIYNLYFVNPNGKVIRRKGCNPSPHDPAYYLSNEDLKSILFTPEFNSDVLRLLAEANPSPQLMREFLTYVKEICGDYDLGNILNKMLLALYQAGYRNLDIFVRDFKEVFLSE